MKIVYVLAITSAFLLAGFLLIRPSLSEIGKPIAPDTTGRVSVPLPAGITRPAMATGPASVPVSSGKSSGPRPKRPTAADAAAAGVTHPEEVEKYILELTNQERAKEGLKPLEDDPSLGNVARAMSDDMLIRKFFAHADPDGLEPQDRIATGHRTLISRSTGENIYETTDLTASSPRDTAAKIVKSWMESEGHRRNILTRDYNRLGVGVSVLGGELKATQNFAEAVGYADNSVQLNVASGDALNLQATSSDGRAAEGCVFHSLDRGTKEGGVQPAANVKVTVGPGPYRILFYFPVTAGAPPTFYFGMQVEVR